MADFAVTLVPFLFVLAVAFGSLEVSGVFKRKQVNLIIAVAMAFFAITNDTVLTFLNAVLPFAIMGFILLFFFGFVMKSLGGDKEGDRDYTLIIMVLMLILIFAANYGLDFFEGILPGIDDEELMTGLGIAVLGIIFFSVYKLWKKGA